MTQHSYVFFDKIQEKEKYWDQGVGTTEKAEIKVALTGIFCTEELWRVVEAWAISGHKKWDKLHA